MTTKTRVGGRLRSQLTHNNLHVNGGEPGRQKHLHINGARWLREAVMQDISDC